MNLRRRVSLCLAGPLAAWALLLGGCRRKAEPPRPVPPDWQVWERGDVSFRFPPRYAVTTEDAGLGGKRLFVSDAPEAGRLILYLVIGDSLPFSMKHSDPTLPRESTPVRIAGHPAERRGPVSGPNGTSSQGIIDLGGKGPSAGAFFSYTRLGSEQQEIAETIVATIQRHP